jgi:hypothetical protein
MIFGSDTEILVCTRAALAALEVGSVLVIETAAEAYSTCSLSCAVRTVPSYPFGAAAADAINPVSSAKT